MASCVSCGRETGGASFCPSCGASQSLSAGPSGAATASATSGLDENVAGLLCYLFGWVSGLVFLVIDKRPFVRFHAAQSIGLTIGVIVSVIAFWIVTFVLGVVTTMMNFPVGWLVGFLFPLVILGSFGAFIFCMYKAFQHERFKLPIIGDIVEKMVR